MSFAEMASPVVFVVLIDLFAIRRWEPRIPVVIGLALLVMIGVTLAVGGEGVAEELAIYAFYFLASGVTLLLIQHVREGHRREYSDDIDCSSDCD